MAVQQTVETQGLGFVEDNHVNKRYLNYMKQITRDKTIPGKCALASTLVPRYLEGIVDHPCYLGDSVIYIVTARKA